MLQVLPHDEAQPEPKMNRRRLLGATATAALGFALSPARAVAEASPPGPVMAALSAYMAAAATRELPGDIAEHARHHLLDTLA
jgi:nitrous oxide reductase